MEEFYLLNLSHSLFLVCYEIFKLNGFKISKQATFAKKLGKKGKITQIIRLIKKGLENKNFFKPEEKKNSMITNINNLFYRLEPNDKELRILASIISSLSKKNY